MLNSSDTYNLSRYRISIPENVEGAVIVETQAKSPADSAGLKTGDIIELGQLSFTFTDGDIW